VCSSDLEDADLVIAINTILPEIENGSWFSERWSDKIEQQFISAMPGLKERAKTLLELLDGARFLFDQRPLPIEEKASSILDANDSSSRKILAALLIELEKLTDWNLAEIENCIRAFGDANDLKLGKVAQPLRAALTGRTTSPGIFDVVEVLGKEEVIARISDQIT